MYSKKVSSGAVRGLSLLWSLILAFVLGPAIVVPESGLSDLRPYDIRAWTNDWDGPIGSSTIANDVSVSAVSSTNLGASKDNTLYESSSGSRSNGAGEHFFVGRNDDGKIRRAVITFDVAGSIPVGATVTGVRLVLHMSRSHASQASIELRRLLADWGEGISNASGNEGGGTSAAAGDATWRHTFSNTGFWANAGGDFSTVASATALVGGTGVYTWTSTPQMVADVQAWLDSSATNFGWLLLGNETRAQTTKRFDTRENANQATRPALIIEYVLAPTLTVNYFDGAPGSWFTFTGGDYPASTTVTLAVNGRVLGTVPTDASGDLVFLVSTTDADEGGYIVTATAHSSATARFVLDSDSAVRPPGWQWASLWPTIGYCPHRVCLPAHRDALR